MNAHTDDPRLTAYALGELEANEKAAVEALLASDPDARQAVEVIRRFAGVLTAELAKEPAPGFTDAQKQDIERAAETRPTRRRFFTVSRVLAWAACLAVIVIVVGLVFPVRGAARRAARAKQIGQTGGAMRVADGSVRGNVLYPTWLEDKEVFGAPSATRTPGATSEAKTELRFGMYDGNRVTVVDKGGLTVADERRGIVTGVPAERQPSQIRIKLAPPPELLGKTESEAGNASIPYNPPPTDREQYDALTDNPFIRVADDPRSTFSIDVDTAGYALVRRFLTQYQRPPRGAVRIEELINYFDYAYAPPKGEHPFAVHTDVGPAPWDTKHRLVKIGLKGREVQVENRPPSNLVFLLDVSGSMNQPNKLPLVQQSMRMLLERLGEKDRVALAVYAGSAGLVLDSTPCDRKADIAAAIDRLQAGGSTAGGAGIQLAYKVARANFIKGGVNRVILCTDGEFNVGITSRSDLTDLIEREAKSGVYLSVLGFGTGNYQDATMEELSNKGNGNYAYIDTAAEAQKALVDGLSGTLVTIAKDVKIQIEFNPARVAAFRLIGYENRVLAHRDFNDDRKDAGDIGAGHTVTALYEVVPVGQEADAPGVDPLKYQAGPKLTEAAEGDDLMTVKLRYKQPDGDKSTLLSVPVADDGRGFERMDGDFQFAAAVAMFGMILRDSPHKGTSTMDAVLELADAGKGADAHGYRAEFIDLARKAGAVLGDGGR